MKKNQWIANIIVGTIVGCYAVSAQAVAPLWTFTPLTATSVALPNSSSAIFKYQVTNNSKRTHTLAFMPMAGVTQVTSPGNCANPFTLSYQSSCILTLAVNSTTMTSNISGGPLVCDQGSALQCYQPSLADSLNIILTHQAPPPPQAALTTSVGSLGLSIRNTSLNAALTGNPRDITITNTSNFAATNVTYTVSPALPVNASIAPASCGTIQPGASCTLIITPGATATTTTTVVTVTGTNTNAVTTNVSIVTYASSYQGGLVFSVDDTTPFSGSIGGKVAALADAGSKIWSSNSAGAYDNGISIWGIDQTSTSSVASPNGSSGQPASQIIGQDNCVGTINGSCNSTNIVTWYSVPNTSPAIAATNYAAGLCTVASNGFSDWYLPSICEAGYDNTSVGTGCGTSGAPLIQNMQSNLVDISTPVANLVGTYWTSTEFASTPQVTAWQQNFAGSSASSQAAINKGDIFQVRCVRAIT